MTDFFDPPDDGDPLDPFAELSDLTGSEPLPALEDPGIPPAAPPRSPLLTGLIVALLLAVISIAFFQLLKRDTEPVATPTPIATTLAPGTTADPVSTDASATTQAADNTTEAPTPPPVGAFEPYVAAGEPVALDGLTLAADAIGPINLGSPAPEAVGRLIASLGEPDRDTGPVPSTGAYGTCAGETERIVQWGPFVAVVLVDPDGTEVLGGYRLDLSYGGIDHEAVDLSTLSGLKAGNSVQLLEQIYSTFNLTYEEVAPVGTAFMLRSSNSGALLLWGPVSKPDASGLVTGIYSPDACGRF